MDRQRRVYEDYVYTGDHCYSRPFARSIRSPLIPSAKPTDGRQSRGLSGWTGSHERVQRISRNSFYSVNTAGQLAAQIALEGAGPKWVETTCSNFKGARHMQRRRCGSPPEGSIFIDVADALDERGLDGY